MIRQGLLVFAGGRHQLNIRVAGLSLLERGIRTMARAGIKHLQILVPDGPPPTLSRIVENLDLNIEFLFWGTAPPPATAPQEDFLLILGDYVHHHASLQALVNSGLGNQDIVVQVGNPDQQNLQQAVSVTAALEFGEITNPDAKASAGAFLCSADLFSPAELAATAATPLEFLRTRTVGREIGLLEEPLPLWHRVVDRRGARAAKNMLFSQVTKSTSGWISRHVNARISIPTSKLLIETGISPHMITILLVLTTGLGAAYLVTQAHNYAHLAGAGILWQFAAIFDRCDGEVARVKLCESKFGEWFDTLTDNIAYIFAYICMLIGMHNLYPETPLYLYLGFSAIGALLLTLALMYSFALKTGSGSLQNYLVEFAKVPDAQKGKIDRFLERTGFLGKRDFFSFFFFVTAIFNCFEISYWFAIIGIHLQALGVMLSQHKMLQHYRNPTPEAPAAPTSLETLPVSPTAAKDRR